MEKKLSFWQYVFGIIGIFVGIGIVIWNIWIDVEYNRKEELLEKYGQTTTGTVLRINSGYRSKTYAVFEYYVDGKRYVEETLFYPSKYDVNIGDRYEVLYYPADPTIRRLELDKPIFDPVKVEPIDSLALDSIYKSMLKFN